MEISVARVLTMASTAAVLLVLLCASAAWAVHDGTNEQRFCGTGNDISGGGSHRFGMIDHYNENGVHKHVVWVTNQRYNAYHEHPNVHCGTSGNPNHVRFPGGVMHYG